MRSQLRYLPREAKMLPTAIGKKKKQLPKLMKMTPRLIFVSTTLHTWQNSPVLQQFQGTIKVEQLYLFRDQSQMPGQGPIE